MKRLFAFTSVIIFSTSPPAVAIRYTVTDLGTLPGYDMPHPCAINNNGQIVGYVHRVGAGGIQHRAVLYDANGTGNNIDLGTLGGREGIASAINNTGQIVGSAESDFDPLVWYATIFDSNGTGYNTSLYGKGLAIANNDDGLIVGCSWPDPPDSNTSIELAAVFRPGEEPCLADLGTLPGYDCARAHSVNNNGGIVGVTFDCEDFAPCGLTRAVLFDPADANNNVDLGALPGYGYATAYSINDRGQIVGRINKGDSCPLVSDRESRAVLFDPTGQGSNIDLGTLPGYDSAEAFCINNKGWIVGRVIVSETFHTHAVLFDRKLRGNNVDLNDCIDPSLDCTLTEAMAINDNGWIVCRGHKPGPGANSFLLKPISAGPADFEPDTDVDLEDFPVLAAAWQTRVGDENYNEICDISPPPDGVIDGHDLMVFAANYLADAP